MSPSTPFKMISKSIASEGDAPIKIPNWKLIEAPTRPDCIPREENITVYKTENDIEFVRTPDERFENLLNFPFKPHYTLVEGLRMHYIDEGSENGEVMLLLHGQPSWSYLYRKMIPILAKARYRVIAVDHVGMGRSDKPVNLGFHTYEHHVGLMKKFIATLNLKTITLFCQDWGGLIGLRIVGDQPEFFARVVGANTRLPIIPKGMNPLRIPNPVEINCSLGDYKDFMGSYGRQGDDRPKKVSPFIRMKFFQQWILYCLTAPNLKASQVLQHITMNELSIEEQAAYDAPFPHLIHKAAIRTFPSMIAAIEQNNVEAWARLGTFEKPFLFLGGEHDKNMGSLAVLNEFKKHVPGAKEQPHQRYPNAGHFIQDDIGVELANKLISFMEANPLSD